MKLLRNKYLLYHLRWQSSIIPMYPVMWILENTISSLIIRLIIASAVGASMFWYLDKWIFTSKKENN